MSHLVQEREEGTHHAKIWSQHSRCGRGLGESWPGEIEEQQRGSVAGAQ